MFGRLLPGSGRWSGGIAPEYRFWKRWFKTRGLHWPEEYRQRLDPQTSFSDYLRRFIPETQEIVRILDVGAGPLTDVGYHWENRKLLITAVDPLAELYQKLYRKFQIDPPVRTVPGRAEELSLIFGENCFDLVQARNALDHAENPLQGLKEMVRCVRPGGWVILNHNLNEGAGEHYRGFHQWDFFLRHGRFFIRGRRGIEWDVANELDGVEIETNPELGDWVQVHIRKLPLAGERE